MNDAGPDEQVRLGDPSSAHLGALREAPCEQLTHLLARICQASSAAEGIWGIDLGGRCTFANAEAARMLGYEVDELVGRDVHDLTRHGQAGSGIHPARTCPILQAGRTGLPCHKDDEMFWRKDGTSFLAKYACYPIGDGNGIVGSIVTFSDLTEDRQAELAARAALQADFRHGLQHNEFVLHYQPQVDRGGRPVGAEALVRWNHPRRGLVPPGEFIPLAEETGQIIPLGQLVLESACRQLAAWARRPETAALTLSVNVSARQLRQADFIKQVRAVLERTGADPRQLKLELTEGSLIEAWKRPSPR